MPGVVSPYAWILPPWTTLSPFFDDTTVNHNTIDAFTKAI